MTQLSPKIELDSGSQPTLKVMIVTGEASGDVHAAKLLSALKSRHANIEAFGMGSSHLQKAGMELVVDSAVHGSVMGLTDVIAAFGGIVTAFRKLVRCAEQRKPDVLILLDFPDFNMRLLKKVKIHCGSCVYFIAPQVWAWRTGRVHSLKRDCSKIIPIFPFEEAFYKKHGVNAKWLGHPFLDEFKEIPSKAEIAQKLDLDPQRPILALLPGSRKAEVERLAGCMSETFQRLKLARSGLQAIVPVAASLEKDWVRQQFKNCGIKFVSECAQDVLAVADVAMVTSGTATLEAAMCQTPFIIVYKTSGLTYRLGKMLVRGTKYIGMPNIVAGEEVAKEFLQDQCRPGAMAAELEKFLSDPGLRQEKRIQLGKIKNALEYSSSANTTTVQRVADEILLLSEENR